MRDVRMLVAALLVPTGVVLGFTAAGWLLVRRRAAPPAVVAPDVWDG